MELRWGLLLSENFGGIQTGFYAKENIFQDNIYLLGGINFLNGFGISRGDFIQEMAYGGFHTMLAGGLGFCASDNFSLEIQYIKTLNEELGRTYYSYYQNGSVQTVNQYWKLYNIFKIGFTYNFPLTSGPGEEKTALENNGDEESPAHGRNVFGGFRIDYNYLSVGYGPGSDVALHLEPALNLGLKLGRGFSLEGRLGLLLSEDISGMQYGLYARKDILSDVIYLMGGVSLLHTTEGPRNYDNWTSDSYFNALLGGGLGYSASENFSIELQYVKVLNQDLGRSYFSFPHGQVFTQNWKLGNMVKIGFAYNFPFPL